MPLAQGFISSTSSRAMRTPSGAATLSPTLQAPQQFFGDANARHLIVQKSRMAVADQRQHTGKNWDFEQAIPFLISFQEAFSYLRLEDRLAENEISASVYLAPQVLHLSLGVLGIQVEGASNKEGGRLPDIRTGMVDAPG